VKVVALVITAHPASETREPTNVPVPLVKLMAGRILPGTAEINVTLAESP
jgi:hypothetical protein